MQYSDLIDSLARFTQQEQPDASFTAATPRFIEAAELRIYREMDFAASSGQNFSLQTTASSKFLDLTPMTGQTVTGGTALAYPWPTVIQGIAAKVGNRWIQFQLTSLAWIDMCWPDETRTAAPVPGFAYYAMMDNQTIRLAPVPDLVYPLRITGQWRPAGMTAANPITWLGQNLPDLLFAGVMCEAFRYQRDFGAGSEDPQALPAWEARFNDAKRSAMLEEFARKGQGPDWQAGYPAPLTMPPPPAPSGG